MTASDANASAGAPEPAWPGQRFGLPESGSGAAAGWGRRVVALGVDWLLSLLVVSAFIGDSAWSSRGGAGWAPLATFAVEASILTGLLGGSAGQLITGVVIRRTSGAPLDIARSVVRTVLICLVIPAVVYNRDRQGLHDMAVDSIALRR